MRFSRKYSLTTLVSKVKDQGHIKVLDICIRRHLKSIFDSAELLRELPELDIFFIIYFVLKKSSKCLNLHVH